MGGSRKGVHDDYNKDQKPGQNVTCNPFDTSIRQITSSTSRTGQQGETFEQEGQKRNRIGFI